MATGSVRNSVLHDGLALVRLTHASFGVGGLHELVLLSVEIVDLSLFY